MGAQETVGSALDGQTTCLEDRHTLLGGSPGWTDSRHAWRQPWTYRHHAWWTDRHCAWRTDSLPGDTHFFRVNCITLGKHS